MMRVLVTGGHGYIGGRLVQALAADPAFTVTAAGRLQRSVPARAATAVVDWSEPASIRALCQGQDAVVHLAAMGERESERDPEAALRANGFGTLALLRAAENAEVGRFVHVSTSKVFGANPGGVIDEASLPRPQSHYAITHRLAEDYVLSAANKRGLGAAVLRLSNAVGAPADPAVNAWTLIANDLCRQAAVDQRIVPRSNGLAWRNFIAMGDVVAALRHALALPAEVLGDGLFHLGGPHSLRIFDLAERVAGRAEALLGRPVKIERAAPVAGERHPTLDWSIEKLKSTGWAPATALDAEIDATLRVC